MIVDTYAQSPSSRIPHVMSSSPTNCALVTMRMTLEMQALLNSD